ncbi:MAG: hypothetical protein Q9222_005327 [Ikaeria aurantiellina]
MLSTLRSSQSSFGASDSFSSYGTVSSQEISSSQSSATPYTGQNSEDSQSTMIPPHSRNMVMAKAEGQDDVQIPEGNAQESGSKPTAPGDIQDTNNSSLPTSMPNADSSSTSASASSSALNDLLPSKPKFPKFSKKQRNTPFTLFDESNPTPETLPPPTLPSLKHTTYQPRLSTSLDGSVRITTGNSPTPSPPRRQTLLNARQPRPSAPLQRSQSAIVAPTFPTPRPQAPIGRSRDSRTWEFYCDSDARDELTKQAEREQSGSALGAIGLIRSRSNASLSSSSSIRNSHGNGNPNKRNAVASSKSAESPKRLKAAKSKPKLARATSSVARLQNNSTSVSNNAKANVGKPTLTATAKPKSSSYLDLLDSLNDSDKENWTPGTQISVSPHLYELGCLDDECEWWGE